MERPAVGTKIIVLGCAGSGKSSFAGRLRQLTGLPLYHLDRLWWREDRTHISREEFDGALRELLRGAEWILDGDYSRTYDVRFAACDTVFFLDYDEEDCLRGIAERLGQDRPDMPWTETELDPELVAQVLRYREKNRPRVYSLIEKYPDRRLIVFRTRAQARDWLRAFEEKQASPSSGTR